MRILPFHLNSHNTMVSKSWATYLNLVSLFILPFSFHVLGALSEFCYSRISNEFSLSHGSLMLPLRIMNYHLCIQKLLAVYCPWETLENSH